MTMLIDTETPAVLSLVSYLVSCTADEGLRTKTFC